MNKSLLTNIVSALILSQHLSIPYLRRNLADGRRICLSGGLTNWLAVHMLFEKVPLLYGSGAIPIALRILKPASKP